eukprot:m.211919 g.211919  ORF g.211919 m.211919 type:complete len:85 (+) comp15068_c1_seq2:1844-2098(+)
MCVKTSTSCTCGLFVFVFFHALAPIPPCFVFHEVLEQLAMFKQHERCLTCLATTDERTGSRFEAQPCPAFVRAVQQLAASHLQI